MRGSSPRVRGKRRSRRIDGPRPRLIPACAGKTALMFDATTPTRAHPRVCGENADSAAGGGGEEGSSPRVRGKRRRRHQRRHQRRLIPACAGKTTVVHEHITGNRAHPRVCGENRPRTRAICALPGSSPRVRGKRTGTPAPLPLSRLIPACAGKTSHVTAPRDERRAHPRVCGENIGAPLTIVWFAGSSPRVRGKQTLHVPSLRP